MQHADFRFERVDCSACPIRHRAVCARADEDELEKLNAIKFYRSFKAGETIVWAGEEVDFVASVVAGVVVSVNSEGGPAGDIHHLQPFVRPVLN